MGAATEGCPPPPPRCRALLLEKRILWAPGSLGGWVHLGAGCSHCPVLDFKSKGPCEAQWPGAAGTRACSSNGPF